MEEETKNTKKNTVAKKTKPKATPKKAETKKTSASSESKAKTSTKSSKESTKTKRAAASKKAPAKATTTTKKAPTKKTTTTKSTTAKTTSKSPSKTSTTKKTSTSSAEKPQVLEHTIIFDGIENKNIADVVNKLEEETVTVEDKVIKRSKVRKLIIILLYIIIIVIILATTAYVINDQIGDKKPKETINSNINGKVKSTYKSESHIKDEHKAEKSPYSNIENISLGAFEQKAYKKEDVHILVASSTCYYCALFEETVNEAYKDSKQKIYRIDIHKLTSAEIETFRNYYAFTDTPTIFAIKDGVVTSELVGTTTKEELMQWIKDNK